MALRFLVTGGTGNFNSTTNWSATSGGASGVSFPLVSDDVIIDANSNNANITVNVASAAASFSAVSYTGTFTMTNNLSVAGNITLASGMTYTGAGTLIPTTTATIRSNNKVVSGGVTFALTAASQTITLADDWTVTGGISHATNAGTINGNNIFFSGNLGGSTLAGGTTTYVFRGSSQNWTTNSLMKNNITFNSSGTVTLGAATSFQGIMLYSAGTITATNNTLSITNSSTLNTAGITWNNVTIGTVNTTLTLNSLLTINGTYTTQRNIIYSGTFGFDVMNYTSSVNNTLVWTLISGLTYRIRNSFISTGSTTAAHNTFQSSIAGNQAILTLDYGATQDLSFVNATDINSSLGQTIASRKGTLSNATNWKLLTTPVMISTVF